jgi:hypothetical protein
MVEQPTGRYEANSIADQEITAKCTLNPVVYFIIRSSPAPKRRICQAGKLHLTYLCDEYLVKKTLVR